MGFLTDTAVKETTEIELLHRNMKRNLTKTPLSAKHCSFAMEVYSWCYNRTIMSSTFEIFKRKEMVCSSWRVCCCFVSRMRWSAHTTVSERNNRTFLNSTYSNSRHQKIKKGTETKLYNWNEYVCSQVQNVTLVPRATFVACNCKMKL